MSEPLTRALHAATEDLESRLEPTDLWDRGRVRRRRTTGAVAGLAAASVAVVAAVSVGLAGTGSAPSPAPSPSPTPTPSLVDTQATLGVVERGHLQPPTDPADWDDLRPYPEELGYWLSPQRPVPLAEDPVSRASAALQYDLGGGSTNVQVIGEDGRWRIVDVAGLDLSDGEGGLLGVDRGSLSPEGTRLALGVPAGVMVVELATAETTTFDLPDLARRWGTTGDLNVFWSPDGAEIVVSQEYWMTSRSGSFAYPEGWRIDVADGQVARAPFDPEHAAMFADGSVVADLWTEQTGHDWERFAAGERSALDISTDLLGVLSEPSAHRDLWVARRELTARFPDRAWDRSGFVALDQSGQVVSMLPVAGVDRNGGGGRVVGWVDDTVAVIAMPGPGGNPLRTVAWDVASGQLWRGPELLTDSTVSVVPMH